MMLPAPSTEPTPVASAVLTPVPPDPTPETSSPLDAVVELADEVLELADAVDAVDAVEPPEAPAFPSSEAMPPRPFPAPVGFALPAAEEVPEPAGAEAP